jgi:AmiR/NasT family two-component response regulator
MGDLQTVRVLIVDDDVLVLETIQDILESASARVPGALQYTVVGRAMNGLQAVELACTLQPDLIMMDIEMPDLDGLAAARQIQEDCLAPVVMLTAHNAPELVAQASDAGVVAYLLKPLNASAITSLLPVALARYQDILQLRRLNTELRQALDTIKTLSGFIPICAWCHRKIEDETGDWISLEVYIERNSDAQFTHGICPDCLAEMQAKHRYSQ